MPVPCVEHVTLRGWPGGLPSAGLEAELSGKTAIGKVKRQLVAPDTKCCTNSKLDFLYDGTNHSTTTSVPPRSLTRQTVKVWRSELGKLPHAPCFGRTALGLHLLALVAESCGQEWWDQLLPADRACSRQNMINGQTSAQAC